MTLEDIDKTVAELNYRLKKEGEKRSIIWILGDSLCEHASCYHCSGGTSSFKKDLKEIIQKTESYEKFNKDLALIDFEEIQTLCLYLMGSFYNNREINPDLRRKILELTSKIHGIKKIILESRPEFIDNNKICETAEILKGKIVEIGIGLDHVNDFYRNKYLNKNIKTEDYERSIGIIKNLHLKVITYVALGCPCLKEDEAIESAVETSLYALNRGSDIISIEPLHIQKETFQYTLFQKGLFSLPESSSLKEVIKRISPALKQHNELRIGGTIMV